MKKIKNAFVPISADFILKTYGEIGFHEDEGKIIPFIAAYGNDAIALQWISLVFDNLGINYNNLEGQEENLVENSNEIYKLDKYGNIETIFYFCFRFEDIKHSCPETYAEFKKELKLHLTITESKYYEKEN